MSEVHSWMHSVSGIFSIYFAIFCYFPHLLNSFSNFECTQSNFPTEETAALHWSIGVFPAAPRENLGKILCEQLVGVKAHKNIQRLENWLKSVLRLFLRQVSPEYFRGQLNKKIAKLDEIRIGSGQQSSSGACKEITWLKLAICKKPFVSNDMKSDGFRQSLKLSEIQQVVFRSFHQKCSNTAHCLQLASISYWSSTFSSVV